MTTTTDLSDIAESQWIAAGDYSLVLVGDTILARNSKGRVLKTVPAKAKKTPEFDKLNNLRVYLEQHKKNCHNDVITWFLKGLPVPVRVISVVWPDPMWRGCLENLVVRVVGTGAEGLLRAADEQNLHLVDLDGENITVAVDDSESVVFPHPAIISDITDWREFASELGIAQGIDQLFRDIYVKPTDVDGYRKAVRAYTNAEYDMGQTLVGRSRSGGFAANFQGVSLIVVEDGKEIQANLEVECWYPTDKAYLDELSFSHNGKQLRFDEIGPIAWSEGIRMAEYVYAGRTAETKEK